MSIPLQLRRSTWVKAKEFPHWVRRRLREIFWEDGWEIVGFMLAMRALHWGFMILLPGVEFSASAEGQKAFLKIPCADVIFGFTIFLLGLWQMAAVMARWRRQLALSSAALVMGWSVVGAMYAASNFWTIGPTSHALTALFSLWLCARMWLEDGEHTQH